MNNNAGAVEVTNVTRQFGAVTALAGVTLRVEPNTICGLLGSNGAGKTTLMSLIAGHDRPTSGTLRVFGEAPFESASAAAGSSFIRDVQRYPDDYKLRHVLRIAPDFHARWDGEYAQYLADAFKVPTATKIRSFSRGQLSALAIVISLASRAPLTIFDEPYLGLDVASRHRFYELLIEDFAATPRTVIVSTHLVGEMEAIFDHAIILDAGTKVFDAPVEDLRSRAVEVAGPTSDVNRFIDGEEPLHIRRLAGLSVAVISGPLSPEDHDRAAAIGLKINPVSLQDLVSALGAQSNEEVAA